jgi:NADPH:quinone reductase-like Zn-dependent oxidoreductase
VKAAVYERYGPPEVVTIRDVAAPVPKDGEVLIRIRATTVSSGDSRVRALRVPRGFGWISRLVLGVSAPRQRILGAEGAGVVEAVGKAVTRFEPGDEVFVYSGASMGCHAELKCAAESSALARKPANLDFGQAAALSFGGATALDFLRKAKVRPGDAVLVNGASGAVGSAAVQLAKHFGATVTGVCSTANIELVRSIGADHVIDYTREDFAQSASGYDIIVDTVGTVGFARCERALKDGGRLVLVAADLPAMLEGVWASMTSNKRVIAGPTAERAEDLQLLAKLAEAGELKPVIDRCLPFEQIVEAHHLADSGRKRGSVVVTLA